MINAPNWTMCPNFTWSPFITISFSLPLSLLAPSHPVLASLPVYLGIFPSSTLPRSQRVIHPLICDILLTFPCLFNSKRRVYSVNDVILFVEQTNALTSVGMKRKAVWFLFSVCFTLNNFT